jgi:anti-sigma factor RsiW
MSHNEPVMERLDVLLMRVVDGEASESERLELLELAESEPRLAELRELRGRLKSAVLGQVEDHLDVVGEVLSALTLVDGWDEAAAELRSELAGGLAEDSLDVADRVMAQLADEAPSEADLLEMRLSAMVDGELSGAERMELAARLGATQLNLMTLWADQGRQLREGLVEETRGDELDLWPAVAERIGLADPEHVPGWEPVAEALRAALAEHASLSAQQEVAMTAAIMNGLPRPEPVLEFEPALDAAMESDPEDSFENSGLGRLFSSPGLQWAAALAAGVLLAVMAFSGPLIEGPAQDQPGHDRVALVTEPGDSGDQGLEFADVNEAEVEELESADDVMVQVFQIEEGAPMFLMIDEGDEGATL